MIGTVRGAFILRADVELLQSDLSEWPTNKLCAPWKVPSALQQNAVNDALLYIPHSLFDDVRVASAARINQNDLQWLGDVFPEDIWFQYNFFHPLDTALRTNPLYRIRTHQAGSDSLGKFVQYGLEHHASCAVRVGSQSEREKVWSERVHHIARLEAAKGRDLHLEEFLNQWSRLYPEEAVKWFMIMPGRDYGSLLQALVRVEGVQKVTNSSVRILERFGEQRKRKATWQPVHL